MGLNSGAGESGTFSWRVIKSWVLHLCPLRSEALDKRAFVGWGELWEVNEAVCMYVGDEGEGEEQELLESCAATYTCPSSWAMVKEALMPFSSLMEQLR